MTAKLTFSGGAGTVTGANFLLELEDSTLLVDCGVLQREQVCDTVNFEDFAYDVSRVDALLITHAHQDHVGRIPRLVRAGFKGVIYSTPATKDLAAIMYEDAVRIMRSEVERHGCDMLYETEHVEETLARWETREYHEAFDIKDSRIEFLDAGHILGSAMIRISRGARAILFSGDLGNSPEPLLSDTEKPRGADYILMESVYGDRLHEGRGERVERLRTIVESVRQKKGTLLIPSFSIERTQIMLYELNDMIEGGTMERIPVFLDSPLAIRATDIFRKYPHYLNAAAQERIAAGDDPFNFPGLKIVQSSEESKRIHETPNPKIIIAGAGMSVGGRIRFHERMLLGDASTTLMFVGYQTPGSLGRRIQDGGKSIQIDGERVRVRAQIETLSGYSGHPDRDQLLDFVEAADDRLEKVFVTMGEPQSSLFLAQRIRDFLGEDAVVPEHGQSFTLDL